MAVVDEAEAAGSPLGRFVRDFVDGGDRPMALCLRTDDMGAIGSRLGLEPLHMSRTRPDGMELTWDLAGLEDALGDRRLPFFIQWHVDAAHHPGRTPVDHDVIVGGLAWVEHGGDRPSLADRLGDHDLDIRPVPGARGLVSAAVRTRTGEILL